ncbi:MAG: hypothetical protein LBF81_02995 [Prevotellaceae bacterium]|jgi:hypothetical protein|nr:hypothetical protein [Prevotellaceae bacterium]
MKNFFLIGMAALLLPACTPQEAIVPDTYLVAETFYLTVQPRPAPAGDWQSINSGSDFYIYAEKNLPAITHSVIETGVVIAYHVGDYDNLLPYIRSYAAGSFEVIRYDIQAGKITFIIESNEASLPPIPDNYAMEFKVVVLRNR